MKDLEARTDVSREAIHFYLREGLLPEPERPKRNVAHYSEEHVARIKLIKRLQEERFLPLYRIKEVLDRADVAVSDDSGGLAAFELSVSSLLNGDIPESDQPCTVVAARAGLDETELQSFADAGVIRPTATRDGPRLDFRDAAIVEQWGRLLDNGFRDVPGYDAGYLAKFSNTLERLAEDEVDLFLNSFGPELTRESAAIATRGIEITNEIFSRLRTQALLRRLADLVAAAADEETAEFEDAHQV